MGRRKKVPPPAFATIRPTWDRNPYVMLFKDLLNSPAYIALSAHAKEAYTILREEYKGPETGPKVKCPYSTFQKKGMRANTVSRAITQLEFFGFIKVEHGGLEHQPSIYHLSEDWKKIKTKEDVDNIRKQFKEHMDKKKKAADRLKETDPPDGIYIRSNESVSKREEKNGQINNEIDSNRPYQIPSQLTEAIPIQVAEAVVENDFQRQPHPEEDEQNRIDMQLLKALVEGTPQGSHETLTEPIATEKRH